VITGALLQTSKWLLHLQGWQGSKLATGADASEAGGLQMNMPGNDAKMSLVQPNHVISVLGAEGDSAMVSGHAAAMARWCSSTPHRYSFP